MAADHADDHRASVHALLPRRGNGEAELDWIFYLTRRRQQHRPPRPCSQHYPHLSSSSLPPRICPEIDSTASADPTSPPTRHLAPKPATQAQTKNGFSWLLWATALRLAAMDDATM